MKIDLKDAQVSVSSSGRLVNFLIVKEDASPELSLRMEFHLSVARAEYLRFGLVEAIREAHAVEVQEQERKRCKGCAGTGYAVIGEVCYAEIRGVCSECGGSGRAKGATE